MCTYTCIYRAHTHIHIPTHSLSLAHAHIAPLFLLLTQAVFQTQANDDSTPTTDPVAGTDSQKLARYSIRYVNSLYIVKIHCKILEMSLMLFLEGRLSLNLVIS